MSDAGEANTGCQNNLENRELASLFCDRHTKRCPGLVPLNLYHVPLNLTMYVPRGVLKETVGVRSVLVATSEVFPRGKIKHFSG